MHPSLVILPALLIFYIIFYAPIGFENNDSGFITGLAYQVANGLNLYSDIIYVRPPITPMLHSLVFCWPLKFAPLYADRVLFFTQIALSSWLSASMIGRLAGWSPTWIACAASAAFMVSAHGFPPMGWHTVDGVLFSVIAMYTLQKGLNGHHRFFAYSGISALLAAGTKQSFYPIIPLEIIVLAYCRATTNQYLWLITPAFAIAASAIAYSSWAGIFADLIDSISSQTSLPDLIEAGLQSYISDLKSKPTFIVFLATLSATTYSLKKNQKNDTAAYWLTVFAILAIVGFVAEIYLSATQWQHPSSIFDATYVATLTTCCVFFIFNRKESVWLWLLSLHAIAWMASISWGYQTVSLYMAPSVLLLAHALQKSAKEQQALRILSAAAIPTLIALFFISHRYFYSLEGPSPRQENSHEFGTLSSAFNKILVSEKIYKDYADVKHLAEFHRKPFVVLPNMPAAHLMMHQVNPIGIDWPLNAEVGGFDEKIRGRLNNNVGYAFIRVAPGSKTELNGKFGSKTTFFITENWRRLYRYGDFDVYRNPNIEGTEDNAAAK